MLASHAGRPFEVMRVDAPEGAAVEPAKGDEQIGDGSRTFVVSQRAARTGQRTGRVVFHVASTAPSGEPAALILELETMYFGTAAAVPKHEPPAASASGPPTP